MEFLRSGARATTSKQMCLAVHRLRGQRAARQGAAPGGRPDRLAPRRPLHRQRPRRALRPEEVRHALHPRLPARPRRARRRVGDLGAVERAAGALRRRDGRRARRVRRARRAGLDHVPPLALVPLGRVPLLHVRAHAVGPRATPLDEYDAVKSAIQQAFIDAGATLSHHHAVGTEHAPLARAGHLGAGRDDAPRAVRRRRPGRQPQPGQDHRGLAVRGRGAQPWRGAPRTAHPAAWSPSRSTRPQTAASPRPPRPLPPRAAGRATAVSRGTAARPRVRSTACGPGRSWASPARSGSQGPQQPAPWPPGGEWLTATCAVDPRHAAPAPRLHVRHPRLAPAPARGARRVLGYAQPASPASSRPAARSSSTATASAPSARGRTRSSPRRHANAALLGRLADAYGAEVVAAGGAGRDPRLVPGARARARRRRGRRAARPGGRRRPSAARAAARDRLRIAGVALPRSRSRSSSASSSRRTRATAAVRRTRAGSTARRSGGDVRGGGDVRP